MAGEFQGMGQRLRGAAGKSRERDSHFAADPVDADAALRELVGILEAACLRAAVGAVSETARGAVALITELEFEHRMLVVSNFAS